MKPFVRAMLVVSVFASALGGCAATEELQSSFRESTTTYSPPANLNADPQSTGLLLVDAITRKPLNEMPLSGAVITEVNNPGKTIQAGSFQTGGFLSPLSGIVVFSDLAPGTYRIVKIRTQNINMWETIELPNNDEYLIKVSAGTPAYFGRIEVKHPFGTTKREVTLKHDKSREGESWKMVVSKYGESPWAEPINRRIEQSK